MKILNIGSLNYDKVYHVEHFVMPKETLIANEYHEFIGGKGLNQSIALAKAQANIYHAGRVGSDGDDLINCLDKQNVNTSLILKDELESGHAIIQNSDGQNCIIINQGANARISEADIDLYLKDFDKNDILLLQNEISNVDYAIKSAKKKGMIVCFNAAPMNEKVLSYPLDMIDILIVNEVEGQALAGLDKLDYSEIIDILKNKYPNSKIVLTLGKDGAYFLDKDIKYYQAAREVKAVDTTAAGDTFVGYFLYNYLTFNDYKKAMKIATYASSLSVLKNGAMNSIPSYLEVETLIEDEK